MKNPEGEAKKRKAKVSKVLYLKNNFSSYRTRMTNMREDDKRVKKVTIKINSPEWHSESVTITTKLNKYKGITL